MLFTSSAPLPFLILLDSSVQWCYSIPTVCRVLSYYSKDSSLLRKPTLLWGRWTETTLVKWKYWQCTHQERALRGRSGSLVCVRNAPGLLTMQWGGNLMVRRHMLLLPSALLPWSQFTGFSQPGCKQSFPSTQRLSGWSTTPLFPPSGRNQACWDSRSLMYL